MEEMLKASLKKQDEIIKDVIDYSYPLIAIKATCKTEGNTAVLKYQYAGINVSDRDKYEINGYNVFDLSEAREYIKNSN